MDLINRQKAKMYSETVKKLTFLFDHITKKIVLRTLTYTESKAYEYI